MLGVEVGVPDAVGVVCTVTTSFCCLCCVFCSKKRKQKEDEQRVNVQVIVAASPQEKTFIWNASNVNEAVKLRGVTPKPVDIVNVKPLKDVLVKRRRVENQPFSAKVKPGQGSSGREGNDGLVW